jgi:hypothetical protein
VSARWIGEAGVGQHLAAAAPPTLDDDRDEVRLLHRPYALDELWDGNAVWAFDAEHDKRFSNLIGQLSLIVKIELLQVFQDVV